ncbi:hydroxylysine kinase-like [Branchiostoma floridae]|uniref:Hydroxylysine kinase n=1 Tax=Branchiostoma floridae TaxID=7739 RepID=A0A9J7KLB9_BRAFL|nr:hydroxylysine kinase-like [Branchiostoma floridae]
MYNTICVDLNQKIRRKVHRISPLLSNHNTLPLDSTANKSSLSTGISMAQSEKAEEILEKPHLTEEQAGQLVETLYGLKVTSLKPLDSYDDLNFYVKVDGPAAWARGYTLKVMNGTDSKNGGEFPKLVFYNICLPLIFLDCFHQDFSHPALHRPEFVWSLKCLPSLENYLHCLKEERHKDINREIILAFREKVLSRMDDLPHGVMHGDFNDLNVLVEEDPVTPSEYRVCGLLDYGDAIVNPYVFDLAIALMYFMSVVKDPITFGGHLVAGFESVRPLTPAEWDVLYYCVVARASQSYVLGHYTASIHPQNTEYLMVTAGSVWKFIDMWWQTPKEEIYKQCRDIQKSVGTQSD